MKNNETAKLYGKVEVNETLVEWLHLLVDINDKAVKKRIISMYTDKRMCAGFIVMTLRREMLEQGKGSEVTAADLEMAFNGNDMNTYKNLLERMSLAPVSLGVVRVCQRKNGWTPTNIYKTFHNYRRGTSRIESFLTCPFNESYIQ